MSMSKCGVICATDCKAFHTECEGCNELDGKVSWAPFYDLERCPIFECVLGKDIPNCALCGQAPCDIWIMTRNPDASDEEFVADRKKRLRNLSVWLSKQLI